MAAARGINWDRHPLGRVPDAVLARRLGVGRSAVQGARSVRGIPPVGKSARRGINWDVQPLGICTDREIADALGVSPRLVAKVRTHRGISVPENTTRPGTTKARKEAAALRRRGWTYRDIGHVFGVTGTTISNWVRSVS